MVGGQLWLLFKLFLTPKTPGKFGRQVVVGPAERFAVGSVTHFRKDRFLLVRHPTGFLALSHQCTHQHCTVDYLAERGVMVCPCHGAQFDLTGAVLAGPASRSLDRFPATIRHDQVIVDTSHRLHM
jgi:cytochrome b6-f complex iron-sulfur subunit